MISNSSIILKYSRNASSINRQALRVSAIEENKDGIVQLNKDQMRHGLNVDGQPMGVYRSTEYADYKASLSSYMAEYPTPDLFLTGAYQKALKIDITQTNVSILSTDSKAEKLKRYNAEGLTADSKDSAKIKVTNTYQTNLITEIRK